LGCDDDEELEPGSILRRFDGGAAPANRVVQSNFVIRANKRTPRISEALAGQYLSDATGVLRHIHAREDGDVACCVRFTAAKFEHSSVLPQVVSTRDLALDIVRMDSEERGGIVVVDHVGDCNLSEAEARRQGVQPGQINKGAGGCTMIGKFPVIVATRIRAIEGVPEQATTGVVWAHEIGHAMGLNHRTEDDGTSCDRNAAGDFAWVMSLGCSDLQIVRLIDEFECNSFRNWSIDLLGNANVISIGDGGFCQ
jgi:hypothetical protein